MLHSCFCKFVNCSQFTSRRLPWASGFSGRSPGPTSSGSSSKPSASSRIQSTPARSSSQKSFPSCACPLPVRSICSWMTVYIRSRILKVLNMCVLRQSVKKRIRTVSGRLCQMGISRQLLQTSAVLLWRRKLLEKRTLQRFQEDCLEYRQEVLFFTHMVWVPGRFLWKKCVSFCAKIRQNYMGCIQIRV